MYNQLWYVSVVAGILFVISTATSARTVAQNLRGWERRRAPNLVDSNSLLVQAVHPNHGVLQIGTDGSGMETAVNRRLYNRTRHLVVEHDKNRLNVLGEAKARNDQDRYQVVFGTVRDLLREDTWWGASCGRPVKGHSRMEIDRANIRKRRYLPKYNLEELERMGGFKFDLVLTTSDIPDLAPLVADGAWRLYSLHTE